MLLAVVLLLVPSSVFAQAKTKKPKKPTTPRLEPTVADFAYANDSERQRFDFWQAKSDKPTPLVLYIHGGGWRNGDKSGLSAKAIEQYLQAGISVAAINYRLSQQAPFPAPMLDSTLLVSTGIKTTFEFGLRAISLSDSIYFIIIRYCAGLPCPAVMPTAMWRMDSASAAAAVKRASAAP